MNKYDLRWIRCFKFYCFAGLLLFTHNVVTAARPLQATTWIVGPGERYTRIQDAVNVAKPGDTISIKSGVYYESVLVRTSDLKIEADDPKNPPIIDGSHKAFSDDLAANTHP